MKLKFHNVNRKKKGVRQFAYCLDDQRRHIKAHGNLMNKTKWKMMNSN